MSRPPREAGRQPVVAIVGRPNVGKSSLFNRMLRSRRAIVDDEPGVTRDRVMGVVSRDDRTFVCIDTGGFEAHPATDDELLSAVRRQSLDAARTADCVVYVVDGSAGLSPADVDLGQLLRRSGRPLVVAVNKVDVGSHADRLHDFHRLGLAPLVATSAAHGRGVDDLLDAIIARLPDAPASPPAAGGTRLALVGRPNVGKSSLLNRILGEERVVVSAAAGTTRDTIDSPARIGGRPYVLVDTAGIRRRGRIRDPLEGHGTVRALGMLARSDLVAVVLDARDGLTEQDARIVGRALEAGRGVVLVVNKWDLLPAGTSLPAWRHEALARHRGLADLPAVAVSARTGEGMTGLGRAIHRVERAYRCRAATPELNRLLQQALRDHAPPSPSGRPIRFFYVTQTSECPPEFTIFASAPSRVPSAFVRYLQNVFREALELWGVPVRIRLRSRRDAPGPPRPRRTRDTGRTAPRSGTRSRRASPARRG